MTLYVVLLALLCVTALIEKNTKKLKADGQNKLLCFTVLFPLLLLLFLGIFREVTVGFDARTYYYNYWLRVDTYSWESLLTDFSVDNGFLLLLKAFFSYTDDWWLVRAILFFITFSLYYVTIAKETPYPSLSLIIFLGLGTLSLMFGILRQALAGAITMIAYRHLRRGARIRSLLFILIASTVHKTALLCIFMWILYFLKTKKFTGVKLVVLSVFSYGAFFAAIPLVTLLYADSRYDSIAENNGGYGMLLFIFIILTLTGHLMRLTDAYDDHESSYLFNLSCGALFIQIGALQWSLLNRTTVFFSVYWCILIPKLIAKLPRQKQWSYYFAVIALFGFMFLYQLTDVDMFVMHEF